MSLNKKEILAVLLLVLSIIIVANLPPRVAAEDCDPGEKCWDECDDYCNYGCEEATAPDCSSLGNCNYNCNNIKDVCPDLDAGETCPSSCPSDESCYCETGPDKGDSVDKGESCATAGGGLSAAFTVDDDHPEVGQKVEFDASSSDGNIDTYDWNLDDDYQTERNGEVVGYEYGSAGSYTAELTVTNADGDSDTAEEDITVSDGSSSGSGGDCDEDGTCESGEDWESCPEDCVPNCWECSDENYEEWIDDPYCDDGTDGMPDCGEHGGDASDPCYSDACETAQECTGDPDCSGDEPYCVDNECVECERDSHCSPGEVCENGDCAELDSCDEAGGSCVPQDNCQGSDGWECRDEFNDDCSDADDCCCAPEVEEPSDDCPDYAPFCVDMGDNESFCCADQQCQGGGGGTEPDEGAITVEVLERDSGDRVDQANITLGGDERENVDGRATFENLEADTYEINMERGSDDRSLDFEYDPSAMGEAITARFLLVGREWNHPDANIDSIDPQNPDVGDEVTFTAEEDSDNDEYRWFIDSSDSGSDREIDHNFDSSGTHYVELIARNEDGIDIAREWVDVEDGGGGNQQDCSNLPEEAQNCMDGRCCTTLQCTGGGGGGPGPGQGQCPPPFNCIDGQCCVIIEQGPLRLRWCVGTCGGGDEGNGNAIECQTDGDCGENEVCVDGQCRDVTEGECDDANEPNCTHNTENDTCQFNGEGECVEGNWRCHNWEEEGPGQRDCEQAECTASGWNNSVCSQTNAPEAAFNYEPSDPEPGQEITFNASASQDADGSVNSYFWNLGSGATASGRIIHHTYSSEGDYTVNLTVTDDQGLSASITHEVRVKSGDKPPIASFNYQPSLPQPGEEVRFNGSGSYDPDGGDIELYQWDVGDGTSLKGESITYSYQQEGNYTVRLKVIDNEGVSNSSYREVEVFMPNQPPEAKFSYSPQELVAGDSAEFDASASEDPDGNIVSYSWERCRGTGDIDCDLSQSGCPTPDSFEEITDCQTKGGSIANFNFPQAGHYFVEIGVEDNEGAVTSNWTYLPVEVKPPTIKFKRDPSYVVKNKEIPVKVLLTKAPNGLWGYESLTIETNNQYIASIEEAEVLLSDSGEVDVSSNGKSANIAGTDSEGEVTGKDRDIELARLTVSGGSTGDTQLKVTSGSLEDDNFQAIDYETTRGSVKVISLIPPIGDADNSPQDLDQDGLFEDVDGNSRLEENDWKLLLDNLVTVQTKDYKLRFDFTRDGRLTTGDVGQLQQMTTTNGEQPNAQFIYNPSEPEIGQPVVFNASASEDPDGAIEEYKWRFGDGNTGTGVNLAHTYQQAGDYNVTLTVTDDQSYINSTTRPLTVGSTNQPPEARFSYSPQDLEAGDSAEFDASASEDPDGNIVSYSWERCRGTGDIDCDLSQSGCPTPDSFEEITDCQTKGGSIANFNFPQAGHYFVELGVKDDKGGADKKQVYLQVSGKRPQLSFARNPTYLVNGREGQVKVTVDKLPAGLSTYRQLSVKVDNSDVITINSAQTSLASSSSPNINDEGSEVTIQGTDLNDRVQAGAEDVSLANLTILAEATGDTKLTVTSGQLKDDRSKVIDYRTAPGVIKVISPLPAVGDSDNSPRDPDHDGLFEDINGNGRLDCDDWVTFFKQLTAIKETSHKLRFDFNRDGTLSSDDVIKLGEMIEEG